MKGKRKVTFLMIGGVALLLAAILVLINSRSIFQEGNPLPVLSGIWRLVVNNEPYAQIEEAPATYIARAGVHDELFAFIEKTHGVKFKGNEGDRYIFEGEGKKVELVTRSYARAFRIWEVAGGAS